MADHDEDFIRQEFRDGCTWLGLLESMNGPEPHGPARDVATIQGTYNTEGREAGYGGLR